MGPLTREEFFDVFERYNDAVWPAQWAAIGICAAAAFWALSQWGLAAKWLVLLLCIASVINGAAFFWVFFASVNPAGWLFGGLFIAQGLLLAHVMFEVKGEVWFRPGRWPAVGAVLAFYAILVYPLLGMMGGHAYPRAPILGLAPCPTMIFMVGMLMALQPRAPWRLLVIPAIWSMFGTAAVGYGVWEDLGLSVAGVAALAYIILRGETVAGALPRHRPPPESMSSKRMT